MDTLSLFGVALGLGFLSGVRLYATVLTLGLALKFDLLDLNPAFQSLEALNDWRIMSIAGAAVLIEFVADKVPWLDSLWDAVHTLVRPVGAALLAVAAAGSVSPILQWILALLAGSVAFGSHATKAAARLTINHSPEPFSNIAVSSFEDVLVPLGAFYTLRHPVIVLALVLIFAGVFVFLAPVVFRAIRVELAAIAAILGRMIAGDGDAPLEVPKIAPELSPAEKAALIRRHLRPVSTPLPAGHLAYLASELGLREEPPALRAVPSKGMRGLHGSVGYMCLVGEDLVFVTRRSWRYRLRRMPLADLGEVSFKTGRLFDRLVLLQSKKTVRFDLFKNTARAAAAFAAALNVRA